jgi:transcriptional regulator with XRE-family HTH domain
MDNAMNPTPHKSPSATGGQNELGALMRYWRSQRAKSQLEVSLDTGISQRHISFIESGRSAPSRQTLIDIAQALEVPLRERNTLLQAAGYAAMYSESPLEALEMHSLRKALDRMLRQHAPFPALVMDRYWNVLMTNDDAPRFFNCFIDMAARKGPRNMLRLIFDPQGLRPFMLNWEQTASSLVQRVYRESVGRVIDEKTNELLRAIHAYPDVKAGWKTADPSSITSTTPVIPLSFSRNGIVMNYFSMVTTVGTPQTISAQELRLECMFPADDVTEAHHMNLLGH